MLAAALLLAAGCGHPLAEPRSGHTATPLPDGGVLVVGGSDSYPGIARVGRWQPRRGRWRAAAPLPEGLEGHTATALLDGRVLVVGGYGSDVVNRAEALAYDPGIDRWRAVAPMAHPRSYHVATRLLDGRVLVLGGFGGAAPPELYDPRRDAWTPVREPPEPLGDATLTVLRDGRVLAVGGAASLVYDPREDRWRPTGPLRHPRAQHTATLLPDGRVLVVGGRSFADGYLSDEALDRTEIYVPRSDGWIPGPPLAEARSSHTATPIGGLLVIAGGMPSGWGGEPPLRSAEVLELRRGLLWRPDQDRRLSAPRGRWSTRSIGRRRTDHTATALKGGRILLVGGRTELFFSKWGLRWSKTLHLRGELGRAAKRQVTGAIDPELGAHGDRAPRRR